VEKILETGFLQVLRQTETVDVEIINFMRKIKNAIDFFSAALRMKGF